MVFYRKYRPQKIEDLDSGEVREKLHSVLSSKSVYHAFLFTGPKGLGKTSAARIVAKVLNCIGRKSEIKAKTTSGVRHPASDIRTVEPCNKCEQCVSITNGTNIDVLEIDGASNRGIDEIRDLREKIRLSPASASKKVYIIDEVHMLTTEAFNALLKTLEEPPSHVVFILCTTEPHKVPATIASRCLQIAFKKAATEDLIRSFKRIAKGEKLKFDEKALLSIAYLSDGSFRDGVKILEEMALLFKNKKITKEGVEEKYKISNIKYQVEKMVGLLAQKDSKKALIATEELVKQGVDIKYFIEQMINEFHGVLLANLGIEEKPEKRDRRLELATEEIKKLIELLAKAYGEIKYAVLPQLPLEMAIVEWSLESGSTHSLSNSPSANEDVDVRGSTRGPAASFPPASAPASLASQRTQMRAVGSPSSGVTPRVEVPRTDDGAQNDIWWELIEKIKTENHLVAGVLRGCRLKGYNKKDIEIETKSKFHKERLEEVKTKELIKKTIRAIDGNNVRVVINYV